MTMIGDRRGGEVFRSAIKESIERLEAAVGLCLLNGYGVLVVAMAPRQRCHENALLE